MVELRWRVMEAGDLPQCLALLPTSLTGAALVGMAAATRVWLELLDRPGFVSAVVTFENSPKVLGFGAAAFVSPEFARLEASQPRPGVNDRFIHAYLSGAGVCLTPSQIGVANAGDGLEQMQLVGDLSAHLDQALHIEAQMVLVGALVEQTRGYRLRGSFGQIVSDTQRRFATSSGAQVVALSDGSCFYRADRESLISNPGGIGVVLFRYRDPMLRLRETDQALLKVALTGATDEHIVLILGLSTSAVKARWRALFQRIERLRLGWWPDQDKATRGPQRRHLLLAYCRDHPEELRPYAWREASR